MLDHTSAIQHLRLSAITELRQNLWNRNLRRRYYALISAAAKLVTGDRSNLARLSAAAIMLKFSKHFAGHLCDCQISRLVAA